MLRLNSAALCYNNLSPVFCFALPRQSQQLTEHGCFVFGAIVDTKECSKCGDEKDYSQFNYTTMGGKSGGRPISICKQCQAGDRYFKKYGMTYDDYLDMVKAQNGVCKICGSSGTVLKKLAIDHDHVAGKVRALLCWNCNSCLGLAKESPAILMAMVEYIRQYSVPVTSEFIIPTDGGE